jgi:uncharacterized protein (TIGR02246 family)
MRTSTMGWLSGLAAVALMAAGCSPATAVGTGGSYADDRAAIEDLQARYLFALDFRDAERYAGTFTEDGLLDYGAGEIRGRQAIHDLIAGMAERARTQTAADTSGLRPAAGRHHISNVVLRIDGDRAMGRAYWFHTGNDNPERNASLSSFGHYEDELARVNGEWLFSSRKIYNEQVAEWAATGGNPAW